MDNKKAKLLNMAYDKLTILGDLRTDLHIDRFEEMLIQFGFEKAAYTSRNFGYKDIFHHEEFGYIEFGDKTRYVEPDKVRLERNLLRIYREIELIREGKDNGTLPPLEVLNSAKDETLGLMGQCDERGFLKRLRDIRFEFNPKYGKYGDNKKEVDHIQHYIPSLLVNKKVSMIHIAADYAKPMSTMMFIDTKRRGECIFRNDSKKNESIYFGKRGSQLYMLAYDKKAENDAQGTIDQYPDIEHVTRFEARIKGARIDEVFEGNCNPYEGLKAFNFMNPNNTALTGMDLIIATGIQTLIKQRIDPMAGLTKHLKKKYREMIESLYRSVVVVEKDFEKEKSRLASELNRLLK